MFKKKTPPEIVSKNFEVRVTEIRVYDITHCFSLSYPGVWYQPGGLCQLHYERYHPMGRPGVGGLTGRGAAGEADEGQRPHPTGLCASGG